RGYEAMAIQVLDDGSQPDLKEGFMAGRDLGPGHPYVVNKVPYHGPNQWLADKKWLRHSTERYIETMRALGTHLAGILALSLDLPEAYFGKGCDEPMVTTRLLHYPPQMGVGEGNQLGAGAHTDWGLLTILMQDDVGGLEVQNADGDWVNAPPDTRHISS
ncbi:isopenicillin N synthase family oxygenase, partial [Sphingobium sp. Ant17]|uniref:isopenicillin N synthase family oxygenase n=1 Tax=Sphingobium sp. Ant17 TaxID=1461752 RepID=UPI0013781F9D